jgi:flagellar basal-body rod protein FlgB
MEENGNAPYAFTTRVVTDNTTEARPDGNNVDSDAESVVLYKAYAQYSYLTQKINTSFSNFRYVLNNAFK